MLTAHLAGFSEEEAIRLAAFLAQQGIYAEPIREIHPGPDVDGVFVYGNARPMIVRVFETWGGAPPPHPVVFIYPIDDVPLDGESIFPAWIDVITRRGLEVYLEETFRLGRKDGPPSPPRTVGFRQRQGGGGIARVEVLGPSGVIFETAHRVQRADEMIFYLPLGRKRSMALRGKVVSRRSRWLGKSRCVASFMGLPTTQRRALGCLLAGYG